MKSCTQLVDIEALVLGELDAAHADALREHAGACRECRDELAFASAERALFARRAEAMVDPPASVAFAVRREIEAEMATSAPSRIACIAPALGRIFRRGHVSVACAAALFIVAAFSRIGNPSMGGGATSMSADDETIASGMLASFRADEPLACSLGSAPAMSHDDAISSPASSLAGSRGEGLVCGAIEGARAAASCEPSVTCSWLRQ